MNTTEIPPPVQLFQLITGYWVSQAVSVVASLNITDHLSDGPKTAEEIAKEIDVDEQHLFRLMRCVASLGLYDMDDKKRFSSTPLSNLLKTDNPQSLREVAIMFGKEIYQAWGELEYAVRSGKPAFDKVFNQSVFEYYQEHEEAAKIFSKAMAAASNMLFVPVVAGQDFSEFKRIVDVGGGTGALLSMILKKHETAQGILFELPEVIEQSKSFLASQGVLDRCTLVTGNFFESFPEGDAYLFSHVLHDWSDEECIKILTNCRKVMNNEARLFILEKIVPQGNEPHLSKLDDINMMVLTTGRERTEAEYRSLLQRAGFDLEQVIATPTPASLIKAKIVTEEESNK